MCEGATNNYFWPEIYTDMPIVWSEEGTRPHPYLDTPTPRRFGTVSPLDPEVFSSVVDFVDEYLAGDPSGRVSPLEVAAWLERLAGEADRGLAVIDGPPRDVEVRRWSADIGILAALGRFFAGKLRSAVAYEVHASTGDREALVRAVEDYRIARNAWAHAAERADVYVDDLTFGPQARIRGHWADRLPAIDADLGDMEDRRAAAAPPSGEAPAIYHGLLATASRPKPVVDVDHAPPLAFRPGAPIALSLRLRGAGASEVSRVTLRYRPMNQALPIAIRTMERSDDVFVGSIPDEAADGAYALAYAFVLCDTAGTAWRYPDLGAVLAQQPYYVVRPVHGPPRRTAL